LTKYLKIKRGFEDLVHKAKMANHVDYNNLTVFFSSTLEAFMVESFIPSYFIGGVPQT
jgi:hypothetical protein